MKSLIKALLYQSARAILKKYRPQVIAITGSIGKTSAKEAIFSVVSGKFKAKTNIKNYNNEYGLPLSIIGKQSPKKNIFGWVGVFWQAGRMLFTHQAYPQVLVLELGIDKPGDMDYLMEIVEPDVAVLTTIGISHLQFFNSEEQILNEKKKIFKNFAAGSAGQVSPNTAILNIDDQKIAALLPLMRSSVITYGFSGAANVHIASYQLELSDASHAQKSLGTKIYLQVQGKDLSIFLPGVLGSTHVYAAAAGIACGLAMHMKLDEIIAALKNYQAQPGRMRLLKGIHNSVIIDDTYNAAPFSMQVALKELGAFPAPRKIAVLGDMLELGALSKISHQDVANEILKYSLDYLVAVGPEMKLAAEELKRSHFNAAHIFWFQKSIDAIQQVHQLISPNSAVLVKGSQGMRMEKIVKQIMAEPHRGVNQLCRQEPDWLLK